MSVGMVIMRPTSIVVAGGGTETASIRAAGGVEFANATSLSLNGVFTATYDNYMVDFRGLQTSGDDVLEGRLRASGTDATGTNYTIQLLATNNTTVAGERNTSQTLFRVAGTDATLTSGSNILFYGPALAQPTAIRSVSIFAMSGARTYDFACTHSLSTAYDGFTLFPNASSISGLIKVYGLVQ